MLKVKRMNMKENAIKWVQDYFNKYGNPKAVIGISGGKDSTVVAYLLVEALGKDNVIGVLMPNGTQADINDSYEVCKNLGIEHKVINIGKAYDHLLSEMKDDHPSEQSRINLAPRLRMTTLYMVAQTVGGRVVGTGNLSEKLLGYYTLWGDGANDMNPIADMFVSEVLELGKELGVPDRLLYKTPSDGLTGKSDEDSLGFTYEQAEKVWTGRENEIDPKIAEKIWERTNRSVWKSRMTNIPSFIFKDI